MTLVDTHYDRIDLFFGARDCAFYLLVINLYSDGRDFLVYLCLVLFHLKLIRLNFVFSYRRPVHTHTAVGGETVDSRSNNIPPVCFNYFSCRVPITCPPILSVNSYLRYLIWLLDVLPDVTSTIIVSKFKNTFDLIFIY